MKQSNRLLFLALILIGIGACNPKKSNQWESVQGRIMTHWGEQLDPSNPLPEYPRPQLVRSDWLNLNGLWDYAITTKDAEQPQEFNGKILVPFAIESSLSGVGKSVGTDSCLWYLKVVQVPKSWNGERIILNFGAVDWQSEVWVNGAKAGEHKGGYDPFSFDITERIDEDGKAEIIVKVWDPSNENNASIARGKQVIKPGGIWYTPVTGIWQTVWIEPVPEQHIKAFKAVPDIDKGLLRISLENCNYPELQLVATALGDSHTYQAEGVPGEELLLEIQNPKLWSPNDPFLYDLKLQLKNQDGAVIDEVDSYFGMRKSHLARDEKGVLRIYLNDEESFQFGPLDQGWWPDGLYTAPTEEALKFDLEYTRAVGFNMLRKHVKVEPSRLYYWCDKMGILVWQDMPSSLFKRDQYTSDELHAIDQQFEAEWKSIMDALYNHPSIVMWVPFNEGWGQYDTERITEWTKVYDPSRLVNNASGWTDKGVGDVHDIHHYPDPAIPAAEENRALVLGEFGGLGLPIENHVWVKSAKNWGYRSHEGKEQLKNDYIQLIRQLKVLKKQGLSAAIYTQTTDCEIEVNGLMTYDRKVQKLTPEELYQLNNFFLPPEIKPGIDAFIDEIEISLSSDEPGNTIRYTLDGTEPDKNSPIYTAPIRIAETCTITAKSYRKTGEASISVSKTYTQTKDQMHASVQKDSFTKGVSYTLYKGEWKKLPDFTKLTPEKKGVCKSLDLSEIDEQENFGLVFNAYINIPEDDVYRLSVKSDDGTRLLVNGKVFIENDGTHGMKEKSIILTLQKGWHPIYLQYFQGTGGIGLESYIESAKLGRQIIRPDMLSH